MLTNRIASDPLVCLFENGSATGLSDWQLLEQFISRREAFPFEVLVSRHGPMVLGICRRMLRNASDVDDAFQATFLVLLRRAGSLGPRDAIAGWLHGVAVRVAQQARAAAARRDQREQNGSSIEPIGPEPAGMNPEVRQILDEEINRLPAKYREPIIRCYIEGQTHDEAARQLGWPLGTVKGRLARARSLLQSRLTRRGVACGTALAALAAGPVLEAAVPARLLAATAAAALRIRSGSLIAHVVSSSIAQLAEGVLSAMIMQKMKQIALACVVSGLFLTGAGVLARQSGADSRPRAIEPPSESPEQVTKVAPRSVAATSEMKKAAPRTTNAEELYRELIQAARHAYLRTEEELNKGRSPLERVYQASRLLMDSERAIAKAPAEQLRALQNHLDRMVKLARAQESAGNPDDADGAEARAYLAEAELLLAQAKTPRPAPAPAPEAAYASKGQGPGKDVRSQAILAKLEQPIAMSFASETPLEDVLKYIKQATQGPNEAAIPIYVDPIGLQEAEKSMTSTVQLDLEGVPLRRTLQLALRQIDLIYYVDDGILVITSQESAEQSKLPPSTTEPSPFMLKQEKAERGEMTLKEMKEFVEELKVRQEMTQSLHSLESERSRPVDVANTQELDQLVKQVRELVGQLKDGQSKGK
jgi:RNA polymerase sigma factor (sigma-70 family)